MSIANIPFKLIIKKQRASKLNTRSTIKLNYDAFKAQEAQIINCPAITNEKITTTDNTVGIQNLLICTKAFDVIEALTSLIPALEKNARVLVLCNGIGIHDEILKLLPPEKNIKLFAGVSSDGALLDKKHHLIHTGKGQTFIGGFNTDNTLVFPNHFPLNIIHSHSIQNDIMKKAFINCAINPLTAIYKCKNGELLSNQNYHTTFIALCSELDSIYKHLIKTNKLNEQDSVLNLATQVAKNTAENFSSMHRDFHSGNQTEINFLNQKIIEFAQEAALTCPINNNLVQQIKSENYSGML